MNLPNLLTVVRLVLVPLILWLILSDRLAEQILGTVLFIVAAVTDHFDGRIARRRRQVTQFGKFADPLADKLLTLSVFIAIVMRREFAAVATYLAIWVAIIAIREIGVTLLRVWGLAKGSPLATSIWGKAKTTAQLFTIITTLVLLNFRQMTHHVPGSAAYYPGDHVVVAAVHVLIIGCMIISVISGVLYLLGDRLDPGKS